MSERDGWNHLYLLDGASGAVTQSDHQRRVGGSRRRPRRRRATADLFQRRRHVCGPRSVSAALLPHQLRRHRSDAADRRRMPITRCRSHPTSSTTSTRIRASTWRRCRSCGGSATASLVAEIERGDISELVKSGWKAPEVFVAKGRDGKTDIWGIIVRPTSLRSREEISRDRKHLRRPARFARAEVVFAVHRPSVAGRARLHRRADRRHGHVESLEGVSRRRVEEPRRRRLPRSHSLAQGGGREVSVRTTSRAWASTAARPAARTRSARCCSIPSSTRSRCPMSAATTTAWTRSGGTSSGWDGRSARSIRPRPTSTTRGGCREASCWSRRNSTPTSIRRRRYQVVNALIKANKTFDMLVIPGGSHGAGRSAEHPEYGERKRFDFFVQHLLGQQPPDWNQSAPKTTTDAGPGGQAKR